MINKKSYLFFGIVVLVFLAVFSVSAAESNLTEEQIKPALKDLEKATGQDINTKEEAAQLCDSEKYFTACADVGKKHNLYQSAEIIQQVDSFVEEIKGGIASQLQSCQTTECLVNIATQLAQKVSAKDSKLAAKLELTPQMVQKKQAVISAAKELGVDYESCRQMDPDTASLELLRNCAKLAKDNRVKEVIPEEIRKTAESYGDQSEKIIGLGESLAKGEFQCGDNTVQGCGNFCLNPSQETKAQGTAGIPAVCSRIASKVFGPEGEKQLQSAYQQVQQVKSFYSYKAQNVAFTTPDGQTLTKPEEIGNYMEQQGQRGNVTAVDKGMDFMIANGLAKTADKDFVLGFVKKAKEQGGQLDFDHCAQDPASCQSFVPEQQKGQFQAGIQLRQTLQQELGFDPGQCEQAASNQDLSQKCLQGAQKALPKLEALGSQSPQINQFVSGIRQNINRADEFNRSRQVIQQQGGPGGCASQESCNSYCSDSSHSAECISFGAGQGIFQGQEAVQKFQQFNQTLNGLQSSLNVNNALLQGNQSQFNFSRTAPGRLRQSSGFADGQGGFQSFGQGGTFPGQGPFEGFQPPGQGGTAPGQIEGFPGSQEQGPSGFGGQAGGQQGFPGQGFGGGQGFSGQSSGPNQGCLNAIQSGDFEKAKTSCSVPQFGPSQSRQQEFGQPFNSQQKPGQLENQQPNRQQFSPSGQFPQGKSSEEGQPRQFPGQDQQQLPTQQRNPFSPQRDQLQRPGGQSQNQSNPFQQSGQQPRQFSRPGQAGQFQNQEGPSAGRTGQPGGQAGQEFGQPGQFKQQQFGQPGGQTQQPNQFQRPGQQFPQQQNQQPGQFQPSGQQQFQQQPPPGGGGSFQPSGGGSFQQPPPGGGGFQQPPSPPGF